MNVASQTPDRKMIASLCPEQTTCRNALERRSSIRGYCRRLNSRWSSHFGAKQPFLMGAMAIQKAMLDTGAAHLQEPGLQRAACTVQPDRHVVDRRVQALRDAFARLFEQIGAPDDFRIFWLERRQESVQTIANRLFKVIIGFGVRMTGFSKLMRIDNGLFFTPSYGSPLKIGDRRRQNTRKPALDRLHVAKIARALHRLQHEALQNFLRFVRAVETSIQEFKQIPVTVHQREPNRLVHRPQGLIAGIGPSDRIIIH